MYGGGCEEERGLDGVKRKVESKVGCKLSSAQGNNCLEGRKKKFKIFSADFFAKLKILSVK